jgi:deoxycytidine triphosphate deaminase
VDRRAPAPEIDVANAAPASSLSTSPSSRKAVVLQPAAMDPETEGRWRTHLVKSKVRPVPVQVGAAVVGNALALLPVDAG